MEFKSPIYLSFNHSQFISSEKINRSSNQKKPCNFETPRFHVASDEIERQENYSTPLTQHKYKFNQSLCFNQNSTRYNRLLASPSLSFSCLNFRRAATSIANHLLRFPRAAITRFECRSLHKTCQVLRSHAFLIFFPPLEILRK